jgi:UDP-N-acetylmuramyl-tripeptide synthetase
MDGGNMVATVGGISEYLEDCSLSGDNKIVINSITLDSRNAAPGSLFVAVVGSDFDGHNYIDKAIEAGCSAIMVETGTADYSSCPVAVLTTTNTKTKAVLASQFLCCNPDSTMFIYGVTGTNGKTTTSYLIRDLCENLGDKCGLIGTIEYSNGDASIPAPLTTPDGTVLYPLFREMMAKKCHSVVMEISSHALDQNRVAGLDLDVAVLTNISRDHLDYHKTHENYVQAKMRILDLLNQSGTVVVNADDSTFAEYDYGSRRKFTYSSGWHKEVDRSADLFVEQVSLTRSSSEIIFNYHGKILTLVSKLTGWFNVENLAAALSAQLVIGFTFEECINALSFGKQVPGRMESIELPNGAVAVVDYAHTPDALEAVLQSCRDLLNSGKLFAVFGCGGDRDKGKRPLMGSAVARNAEMLIVTSDNPRSEDPETICDEIVEGCIEEKQKKYTSCEKIVDRKMAIEKALNDAGSEDMIIIAGKGHENYQIFADETIDFDDREIVRNWIRRND